MGEKTIGFIGSGRVAKILIGGLANGGEELDKITIFDINNETSLNLKESYPDIEVAETIELPAKCDIVFLAIHPPAIKNVLESIKTLITPETIIVSLAPKIKLTQLKEIITNCKNIVRMLPNAPSIVNAGYNPTVYSTDIDHNNREYLESFFDIFGSHPEIEEESFESYAILSAMGPTYFWFQFYELLDFAKFTGLGCGEGEDALQAMINGTLETMLNSGLSKEDVMDLVASQPIKESEEDIKNIYRKKLSETYKKLKS